MTLLKTTILVELLKSTWKDFHNAMCVTIVIEGEKMEGGNWFYLRNWLDHKKYEFQMRKEHVSEFAVNSEKAFWLFKVRESQFKYLW